MPPTSYGNGSALVFYNSTSYRDDLLWAAAWMYKATGERVRTSLNNVFLLLVRVMLQQLRHMGQQSNARRVR